MIHRSFNEELEQANTGHIRDIMWQSGIKWFQTPCKWNPMDFTHQCLQGEPAKRPFVAPEGAAWSRQLAWSDVTESDYKKKKCGVGFRECCGNQNGIVNWPFLAYASLKTVKTISKTWLSVGVNIWPTWCQQHVCKLWKLVGGIKKKSGDWALAA